MMRNLRLVKVYGLLWSDGEVHCEHCGAIMHYSCYSWFCENCDD